MNALTPSERTAFLRKIAQNIDDVGSRSAYADRLQESDDPQEQEYGEALQYFCQHTWCPNDPAQEGPQQICLRNINRSVDSLTRHDYRKYLIKYQHLYGLITQLLNVPIEVWEENGPDIVSKQPINFMSFFFPYNMAADGGVLTFRHRLNVTPQNFAFPYNFLDREVLEHYTCACYIDEAGVDIRTLRPKSWECVEERLWECQEYPNPNRNTEFSIRLWKCVTRTQLQVLLSDLAITYAIKSILRGNKK